MTVKNQWICISNTDASCALAAANGPLTLQTMMDRMKEPVSFVRRALATMAALPAVVLASRQAGMLP